MRKRDAALLNQIEEAGLSATASVADALRACIALGGRAGSTELREWAQRELNGYFGDADLPEYRRIAAPLRIDAVQGNQIVGGAIIKGQRISPGELPDVVADKISEELELRQSIGEIEKLAHHKNQDEIRLSPPMGADIVRVMNSEMDQPLTAINELYWAVSTTALMGVVDRVRTMLVALVAEIRASLPDNAELPSGALADQAVQVVVHGSKNRVVTTTAQAGDTGGSSATTSDDAATSPLKRAAWWLIGLATVAGAVFAGWQVFGGS